MAKESKQMEMPVDLSVLTAEQLQNELAKRKAVQEVKRVEYKELMNTCIRDVVDALRKTSLLLAEVKLNTFQDLKVLLDVKLEVYDVKEQQQTHTFSDVAGNSITYGYRIMDGWDDTVHTGIAKVNEFIQQLIKDEDTAKLVNTINRLLKKDAKGNLKASRVLELSKMAEEFNDTNFTDAVGIITKAYTPVRSCFFIEANYTDEQGKKVAIPLSISAVDFPAGTDIKELFPIDEPKKETA